jgi:glycosyltransferase involved in cell wall biosynthesis
VISVIIPVYNGAQHIERICSVFEAQFCQDFELIFVNDGSTDGTLREMQTWQKTAPLRIKVVDQTNKGVSAARNAGIDAASGEYLCFNDVDDTALPGYLSEMLAVLTNERVDLVFCKHMSANLAGGGGSHTNDTGRIRRVDRLTCLRDFLYGRLVSGCWTLMIRATVVAANELLFAESFKFSEDLHFVWRAIACCEDIAYLDQTLYVYVIQSGSATSHFTEERFDGYQLMQELETYFDKIMPAFAREYRKYGAARIAWSIAWQSALHNGREEYLKVVRGHCMRQDMAKLITFKDKRVAASSLVFFVSPLVFRKVVREFVSPSIANRLDGGEAS